MSNHKKNKLVSILNYLLFITSGLFLISLVFSFILADNFLASEIAIRFCALFFVLFVTVILFYFFLRSNTFIKRILSLLFSIVFFLASIYSVVGIKDIYDDRHALVNEEYKVIVGIPTNATFETGRRVVNPHLSNLDFGDLRIDVLNLWIPKEVYYEKYEGEKLEVHYLPNSKVGMEINMIE